MPLIDDEQNRPSSVRSRTVQYNVVREDLRIYCADVGFRFTLNTKCQEHMVDGRMEMDLPHVQTLSHAVYVLPSICTKRKVGREELELQN